MDLRPGLPSDSRGPSCRPGTGTLRKSRVVDPRSLANEHGVTVAQDIAALIREAGELRRATTEIGPRDLSGETVSPSVSAEQGSFRCDRRLPSCPR